MTDHRAQRGDDAVVAYKEIAALATESVERLHRHERERAAELEERLAAEHDRAERARQQEQDVAEGVRKRWNAAMEALWEERWMRVTRMPAPDPSAPADTAEDSIRAVQAAYLELHEALGMRRWSLSSWLPGRPER